MSVSQVDVGKRRGTRMISSSFSSLSSSSSCFLVLLLKMKSIRIIMLQLLVLFHSSSWLVQACNICGCEDGCSIGNSRNMVTFVYNNHTKQMSCGDLQDKIDNGGLDEEFCVTQLIHLTWEKCDCYNKFGQLLTDYYATTIPPAIPLVPLDPPVDEAETTQQPSSAPSLESSSQMKNEDNKSSTTTESPLDVESVPTDSSSSLPVEDDNEDVEESKSSPTMFPSLSTSSTIETEQTLPPHVVESSTTAPSEAIVDGADPADPTPAPDVDLSDTGLVTQIFRGISMVLEGIIVEFDEETIEAWVEITKIFYENVHRGIIQEEDEQIRRDRSLQTIGIQSFETDIRFDDQIVSQKKKLSTIRYTQSVRYTQTLDTAPSTIELIEGPFINPAINRQYVELLKELSGGAGHDLFANIQTETIAVPTIPDQSSVEEVEDITNSNHKKGGGHGATTEKRSNNSWLAAGGWSMGSIAGLTVAAAFAIGLTVYVCRRRRFQRSHQRDNNKKFRSSSSAAPYDSSSDEFDYDGEMGGCSPYMDDNCHFEDPMNDEQLEQSMRSISRDISQSSGLSGRSSHSQGSSHSRNTPIRTDDEVKKSLQHAYMDDLREHTKRPPVSVVVDKSHRSHENTTIYRPEQPAERSKDEIPTTTRMNTMSMDDLFPEHKSTKNQCEEQTTTKRRSTDEDDLTKPSSPPQPTTMTTITDAPSFSRLEDFFPDEDGMNLDDLYLREELDDSVFQDDPSVASHGTNYSYNRAFVQHSADDNKSVVSTQSVGGGNGIVFADDDMYEDVNNNDVYKHYQQHQLRQQRNNHHQQQHRHQQQRHHEPEIVVIEAPPGWLGVVIDTPEVLGFIDTPEVLGSPVVYEIMESSPIAGQIRLGDQLISVDDIDVQDMTATQVSRIISQKANNPVRTFVVIRFPDCNETTSCNNLVV